VVLCVGLSQRKVLVEEYWFYRLKRGYELPDEGMRKEAARALVGLRAVRLVPRLVRLGVEHYFRFQWGTPLAADGSEAAKVIFGLRAEAIEGLIAALNDKDEDTRSAAAWILEEMWEEATPAAGALCRALDDPCSRVRLLASIALGHLGREAKFAVKALMERLLHDEDADVRQEVAMALRVMGPYAEEAVGALVDALSDRNNYVRAQSIFALNAVCSDTALVVTVCDKMSKDEDDYVRETAAKVGKQRGASGSR